MKGFGFSPSVTLAALISLSGSFIPAWGFDIQTMVIDSVSAHPEVKEKIHSYQRTLADTTIANSGWRPSVDLQASTGLYDTESPSTGNESVDYDSTQVELSVTQNLFNGYDTTNQVKQTKAIASAALYDIYDVADNIALQAIQAYLEVLKQRRLYQLALENVAAHEDILSRIRERNESGVGRRSQLQQTEGRVARAHASLIAQQNNLEDAATQMHQILGRYVSPEQLVDPVVPNLPEGDLDALIDIAIQQHPAIQVAGFNIQAALSDQLRSMKNRYPTIDLRLATEVGDDIGGLDGDTEETSLVLNLTYNFYNGGRDKAEQRQKTSAVYEQKEFASRTRRQIINTLRLSWVADNSLTRQLEFLQTHIIKASETVESYKEEFFIGQRDLIDLLDAENERNSAQNQYTEAKYDELGARYRIYEGLGDLFAVSGVDFHIDEQGLQVARLTTEQDFPLPLPDDEDQDQELTVSDHCDNSLLGLSVNSYGCRDEISIDAIEISPEAINSAPQPEDDYFEMESNSVFVISRAQLLENDIDEDNDSLEIIDVSQPDHGRLAMNSQNNIVYRPAEGFTGPDQFRYTASDKNGNTATAVATVNVIVKEPLYITVDKVQLVNFIYDEAELTESSKIKVDNMIEQLKRSDNVSVEIYTYTDDIGSDGYNERLSEARAAALKALLINKGIPEDDINAVGKGEKNPIADNATEAGQAINRRGEFVFKVKTPIE
ncbi:MAG: TolC family outer membrane protein [Pseudomonadota bacterium]